jgi:hypothetical protein
LKTENVSNLGNNATVQAQEKQQSLIKFSPRVFPKKNGKVSKIKENI